MERLAVGEGEEEGERSVRQWERWRRGQPCPYLNGEPCWYNVINYARYDNWEDSDNDEVQNSPYTTFRGPFFAHLLTHPLPKRTLLLRLALLQKPQLTAEEAERNAKLLVAEVECLKKKAEKKRMKKKITRQKDWKRQEKQNLELKAKNEAEELDFSSTFVSKARCKVDVQSMLPRKEKGGKNPRERKAEKKQKAEFTGFERKLVTASGKGPLKRMQTFESLGPCCLNGRPALAPHTGLQLVGRVYDGLWK